jgi:hypothetical protein
MTDDKMLVFSFRMTKSMQESFKKMCFANGVPMCMVLRTFIKAWIEEQNKKDSLDLKNRLD